MIGTDRRTGPLDATLVNGTASHALDYDDMVGSLAGHPSAMLVSPLLALGEYRGSNGRDLALAYVVGFETGVPHRAAACTPSLRQGLASDGDAGIFGTVAAAARLLNLTAEQTAAALGLAASLACGLKANFGTMTKSLHVGTACATAFRGADGARGLHRQSGDVRAQAGLPGRIQRSGHL